MAKWIKNNTGGDKTYVGQLIGAGAYYELQAHELVSWANNSLLLTDIGNADAIVAKDDSGNNDIADVSDAINYLKDDVPKNVEIVNQPKVHTEKGQDPFVTMVTHNWCDNTTWPATDDSEFIIEPSTASKKLLLKKAEVQFTHDVKIATMTTPGEIYFETWAYNPLFDSQSPTDPDDPDFELGDPENPLRFMVTRDVYKDLGDVFDLGNEHSSMSATVDGLPGVTTVHFNYDQIQPLLGSQGVQIRFCLKDDAQLDGTKCTVAIVVSEVDE